MPSLTDSARLFDETNGGEGRRAVILGTVLHRIRGRFVFLQRRQNEFGALCYSPLMFCKRNLNLNLSTVPHRKVVAALLELRENVAVADARG